nr:hypothetical protein Q903MT_gene239 [Picea sitchensis]
MRYFNFNNGWFMNTPLFPLLERCLEVGKRYLYCDMIPLTPQFIPLTPSLFLLLSKLHIPNPDLAG